MLIVFFAHDLEFKCMNWLLNCVLNDKLILAECVKWCFVS